MNKVRPIRLVVRINVPRARSSFASPLWGLLGFALFVASLTAWHLWPGSASSGIVAHEESSALVVDRVARVPDRIVYPYSVIAGGVSGPEVALAAARRDGAVRAHYTGIRLEQAWMGENPRGRLVHVSYRKGDRIYWTRNKVRLVAGERLLTDGENEIRARCGNRIAEQPLGAIEPVGEDPGEDVLDMPILEEEPMEESPPLAETASSTILVADPPLLQPAEGQLMLSGGVAIQPENWWLLLPYPDSSIYLLSSQLPPSDVVQPSEVELEVDPQGLEWGYDEPAEVPEPSALALAAIGLAMLYLGRSVRLRALRKR